MKLPANVSEMSHEEQSIQASATRKADGWYPTLEYAHGGRVIGDIQCATMAEAVHESENMIRCMADHPVAFRNNHPAPNQLIDLSNPYE